MVSNTSHSDRFLKSLSKSEDFRIKYLNESLQYSLITNNCIDFIQEILIITDEQVDIESFNAKYDIDLIETLENNKNLDIVLLIRILKFIGYRIRVEKVGRKNETF